MVLSIYGFNRGYLSIHKTICLQHYKAQGFKFDFIIDIKGALDHISIVLTLMVLDSIES